MKTKKTPANEPVHGIVIPCYNESSRLDLNTFIEFAKLHKGSILCFVNDGSADDTRATLASIKNFVHDNVYICEVLENAGKAEAVRKGSLFLYNETAADTIGFLDADLSTGFEEYHELIDAMKNNSGKSVVFGSRNMKSHSANIERNPVRKLLSEVIRLLIFCIIRVKIYDSQCGAKVFKRHIIPNIYDHTFCSRWLFDVEIILRMRKWLGKRQFVEIFLEKPLKNWVHMDGSKLGLKDSIMIPASLSRIWINYEYKSFMQNFRKWTIQTSQNLLSKLFYLKFN
ncbi:MAG: glycosyltransferase [Cyclobacteriaceae bacterium]